MSLGAVAASRVTVDGWQPVRPGQPRIGVMGDIVVGANAEEAFAATPARFAPAIHAWASGLDLLVVTLDATFSGPDLKSWAPRVFAGPRCLDTLPRGKLTLVNLANNHAFDGGSGGFLALTESLRSRGFATVGAGLSREEAERPWTGDVGGRKVTIFAAAHSGCHPRAPLADGGQVALLDSPTWWRAIEAGLPEGLVVAVLHGGIQGSDYPSPRAVEISERLLGLGVQLVVWTHAHVTQGIVPARRGGVAYGLGDALYLPLAGDVATAHHDPRWDVGLFLELEAETDRVSHASAFFVQRRGLEVHPLSASERELARFRRISAAPRRAGYGLWWRGYRLREDVALPALRIARRRGLRGLDRQHLLRLVQGIRNARADAHDV
jgi:capsule synthesis protein PGA_cap